MLDAPRKIDLTFTSQQRYCAHLAQIRTHRAVCVDGLFDRLSIGMKNILCRFGIEEFCGFLLEIDSYRVFAQKLFVIIMSRGESPPVRNM